MLYGLVLAVHVLLAIFMIVIILLQGGRGGLGETMGGAAAQSLFGGGANIVMTKLTAFCAGLFMVTSLSLAWLSAERGRSVMDQLPAMPASGLPLTLPGTAESAKEEPAPPKVPSAQMPSSNNTSSATPAPASAPAPAPAASTTP